MKMEEHIAFLKILRIPYKEAAFRAFHHIFNEHRDEIDIEDLIRATCVYDKPPKPAVEPVTSQRPRDFRDRGYRRPRRFRDRRPYRDYRDRY